MGKLPKSQYAKVPMLGELTEVGEELKRADAEILRQRPNSIGQLCKLPLFYVQRTLFLQQNFSIEISDPCHGIRVLCPQT